jgi:hypothetical protein
MLNDSKILDILRSVQPYNVPEAEQDTHPLQFLRTINAKSKHRAPAVVISAIDQGHYVYFADTVPAGVPVDVPAGSKVPVLTLNNSPLKDGNEMAFVPYERMPKDGLPEYDEFDIAISLEDVPMIEGTLQPLHAAEALGRVLYWIDQKVLGPITEVW